MAPFYLFPALEYQQKDLFLQIQRIDDFLVRLRLVHLQVREELPSVCDVCKQTTTSGIVLLVLFQMLRDFIDLLGKEPDLDLGRPGVLLVRAVLRDDLLLCGALESHKKCGGSTTENDSSGLSVSNAKGKARVLRNGTRRKENVKSSPLSALCNFQKVDKRPPFDYAQGKPHLIHSGKP